MRDFESVEIELDKMLVGTIWTLAEDYMLNNLPNIPLDATK